MYQGRQPIYVLDENGEKIPIFVEEDGTVHYQETGSYTSEWTEPVEFLANIAQSGGEAEATAYGMAVADFDATLVTENGYVPLVVGSRIWRNSEVLFTDEENTEVDEKSADFVVVRVLEALTSTKYLLKSVEK